MNEMSSAADLVRYLAAKAWGVWSAPASVARFSAFAGALILWLMWKRAVQKRWPLLVSRNAATDAIYTAFYLGGIYSFFFAAPLFAVSERTIIRFAPYLRLHLLDGAPAIVQILVVSFTIDFAGYWAHRLGHESSFFWRFHRIHHSQTELTPLTGYRFHVVEALYRGLAPMIPGIMLGSTTASFTIAIFIDTVLNAAAHSGGSWTFGALGYAFVSPQYHRVHHALDPELHHGNYGLTYSIWDRMFGTAVDARKTPEAYGISETVPESFFAQLVDPFLINGQRGAGAGPADGVVSVSQ